MESPGAATTDFATFGPVHLEVTDRERSIAFWRDLVGLEEIGNGHPDVRLGVGESPLVVLHPVASQPASPGHSGLYHLALHLPDEPEFARVLARLLQYRYPIAPTDHVMSKAIYLNDPDGLGLELTLETPERLGRWAWNEDGPDIVDSDGRRRSGRDPLDVREVLSQLPDRDVLQPMPPGTTVGHVHLHVSDLDAAHRFYRDDLGFLEATYVDSIGMADLHAGGRFPHRMAINVWQGRGAPQAPPGMARLRHFTIRYDTPERLEQAAARSRAEERVGTAMAHDPAGNAVLLTA